MRRKRFVAVASGLVLFLAGCASMRVSVKYDETQDFSQYQSYYPAPPDMQDGEAARMRQALFTQDVLDEIRPIMEAKGFRLALGAAEADLLIHFFAFVKDRRDFVPPTYRVGRWGRAWVSRPGHVVHYKEGTLGIDLVDREKKELVWQGIGKGILDRQDPKKNLLAGVREVLDEFPPK
jgi:hypothetical protein